MSINYILKIINFSKAKEKGVFICFDYKRWLHKILQGSHKMYDVQNERLLPIVTIFYFSTWMIWIKVIFPCDHSFENLGCFFSIIAWAALVKSSLCNMAWFQVACWMKRKRCWNYPKIWTVKFYNTVICWQTDKLKNLDHYVTKCCKTDRDISSN